MDTLANSGNKDALWILPFGAFFGVFGAVIGLWLRRKTKVFLQTAVETTGVYVKAVRKQSGTDMQSTSYRVVEFETAEGETIHYRTMAGVPWAARSKGKSVAVLYDPMKPDTARLNSWQELVLPWLIFLLTGLGIVLPLVVIALAILFYGK